MEKRKEKKGNLQHVIKETERVNGGLSLRGEWKQITIENNKRTGFVQLSTLRFSVSLEETEPLG